MRELAPEGTGPSGLGHDGKSIWIGSTYSREIIRADAKTGETMEKHFTPGAGVIYRRTTDTPPARIPTAQKVAPTRRLPRRAEPARRGGGGVAAAPEPGQNTGQGTEDGLGVGRGGPIAGNPGPPAPGTGAHGSAQNGKLWIAVPRAA